jgi:NAD(P)-dependent dehydrogenase (short-subunit alcohol dehydrogenase family)
MNEALPLSGKVVAIVGTGSEFDRAVALGCAEAGADLALGAASPAREHEYGMNSIANEIWAIGREHFVLILDGPDGAASLVAAARERLGRCDALVADAGAGSDVPIVGRQERAPPGYTQPIDGPPALGHSDIGHSPNG